jgi:hypothetical protein
LGMLDDFSTFIAQQPQEDFLCDIVEVGDAHSPAAGEKFAQRRAPAPEPLRERVVGRNIGHVCKTV